MKRVVRTPLGTLITISPRSHSPDRGDSLEPSGSCQGARATPLLRAPLANVAAHYSGMPSRRFHCGTFIVAELLRPLLRRQLWIAFHHPPALVAGEQFLLQVGELGAAIFGDHGAHVRVRCCSARSIVVINSLQDATWGNQPFLGKGENHLPYSRSNRA